MPFRKGHKFYKGGERNWFKKGHKIRVGMKHNKESKKKISITKGGTGIALRTHKKYYHLTNWKYKEWRSKVFERDNWTCQTCRKRGCYLEPHHIKSWTKYLKLRYDIENGVTLCYECHKLVHKKQ